MALTQSELAALADGPFELAQVQRQAQALTAEVERLRSEVSWSCHQRDVAVEEAARALDAHAALVDRWQGLVERVQVQDSAARAVPPGSTARCQPSAPVTRASLADALAPQVPAGAGLAAAIHTAVGDLAELSMYAMPDEEPQPRPSSSQQHSGPKVPPLSVGGVDLPDALLVDLAAAGHRLAEWATLVTTVATDELARRRETESPFPDQDERRGLSDLGFRSAVAEVAAVCGVSEHGVRNRVELIRELPERLPDTWDRVVRGRLDLAKARVLHEQTIHLGQRTAQQVEHRLLDKAAQLTWSQLRVRAERLAARLDPAAYEDLVESCVRASTGVRFSSPGPGLGAMTVTGRASDVEEARRAVEALTAAADTSDPAARGPAAAAGHVNRADVVLDLLVGAAEQLDRAEPGRAGSPDSASTEPMSADVAPADATEPFAEPSSTQSTSTEFTSTEPASTEPASTEFTSTEPVSTEPVSTEPASTEFTSTEPASTDFTSTEPVSTELGSTEPASTEPSSESMAASQPATMPTESAPATSASTKPASTESGSAARHLEQRPSVPPDPNESTWYSSGRSSRPQRRAQIRITVPFSALSGDRCGIGELDGYGPIPAGMLDELIATHGAGATWQCAVLDDRPESPVHGTVIGIGKSTCTPRYTPGPLTRALVEARHRTCRFPGCRRQAEACDLDHRSAYDAGGATCDCNLHPLCRHHHRLKNGPRPFVPKRANRRTEWTTPAGHTVIAHDDDPPF